ncbi:MAG TPA: DsbA family protein [Chloroflexota bacterium]|jgi:predicted DsbA family dithiol-disulfide isomerase
MASAAGTQEVKLYFDPICPWAWRTSLWLREVRQVRPLELSWGFFSLAEINRAAGNPPRERHQQSSTPFRIMALARRQQGVAAVDRLYLAFGRAHHDQKQNIGQPDVIASVLDAAGFDRGLQDAALADDSLAEELAAEHAALAERGAFGVPTLEAPDAAGPLYGPIIDQVPTGEAAGELWDHTAWLLAQPHVYEFKRAR